MALQINQSFSPSSEVPGRVVTTVAPCHGAPRAAVRSGVRAPMLAHVPPRPSQPRGQVQPRNVPSVHEYRPEGGVRRLARAPSAYSGGPLLCMGVAPWVEVEKMMKAYLYSSVV